MNYELILLTLLPIVLALPVYLIGRFVNVKAAKFSALIVVLITTIYSLILWISAFVSGEAPIEDGFFYHFQIDWIADVGIYFSMGVDGLSMPLVVLTQVIFLLSIISSFYIKADEPAYYGLILLLLSAVTGTFVSLDIFLFYIFWELVLVPMFILIHIWGGPDRRYAAIKFFIYTHLASLVMLIGLFFLYINGGRTFYLPDLKDNLVGVDYKTLSTIFWLVFIGFVTKFPQVPVHTWLPDAHVQAPSPGSAILAGLLLKMGGYGLMRIPFWLYQDTGFFETSIYGRDIRIIIAIIGVVSMVYPAFIALQQNDLKKMIAYSSISHMGIVLMGLAAYNEQGFNAAMYMMIAHGIISPGLFLLAGVIEHNTKSHTRDISKVSGLAHKMPFTGGLFVTLAFASAGLPGMAGFIAEFNAFVAMFDTELFGETNYIWLPIIAVMSVIITAGYYLWAVERVVFNKASEEIEDSKPAKGYEVIPIGILAVLSVIFGVIPGIIWDVLNDWSVSVLSPPV